MSIMPQESEQDVIDRLRLWNAMREPVGSVKLSSVREVLADALTVIDKKQARIADLEKSLRAASLCDDCGYACHKVCTNQNCDRL